jgi:hypothetical protein
MQGGIVGTASNRLSVRLSDINRKLSETVAFAQHGQAEVAAGVNEWLMPQTIRWSRAASSYCKSAPNA